MGKKYIVEVDDVPYIKGTEKLYECPDISGIVLEEDDLAVLEENSIIHAINLLNEEKWLEAHDKEISEGVWRFAELLVYETCAADAQKMGLLSENDIETGAILEKNSYKGALEKYRNYITKIDKEAEKNSAVSWDRFTKEQLYFPEENETKMYVKCPECGELLYRDNTVICASNPPKSKYFCKKCKWVGYN